MQNTHAATEEKITFIPVHFSSCVHGDLKGPEPGGVPPPAHRPPRPAHLLWYGIGEAFLLSIPACIAQLAALVTIQYVSVLAVSSTQLSWAPE
jgi:hypothetical protein